MMKYVKVTAGILSLFLVTAMGILLPLKFFDVQDRHKMAQVKNYDVEQIRVTSDTWVSFEDKFRLLYYDWEKAKAVSVDSTKKERKQIKKALMAQIREMYEIGVLPEEFQIGYDSMYLQKYFVSDFGEPEVSMYLWNIQLTEAEKTGELILDIEEESGKIIAFRLYSAEIKLPKQQMWERFREYINMEDSMYPSEMYTSLYGGDIFHFSTGAFHFGYLGSMESETRIYASDEAAG